MSGLAVDKKEAVTNSAKNVELFHPKVSHLVVLFHQFCLTSNRSF